MNMKTLTSYFPPTDPLISPSQLHISFSEAYFSIILLRAPQYSVEPGNHALAYVKILAGFILCRYYIVAIAT